MTAPPPNWYEEAHGAIDVVLDDYLQNERDGVDKKLWMELEHILQFLDDWWAGDKQQANGSHDAYRLSIAQKWIRQSNTPREHIHELLDTAIRNSLTDIMANYQQTGGESWIVDHGKFIKQSIGFTTPEEFNLEGDWAHTWNQQPADSNNESTFDRPDAAEANPAGNRTMSAAANYPYDRPVSYGRNDRPNAWESLQIALDEDLAIGDMGMGGLPPDEMELDVLRQDFSDMFADTLPDAIGLDAPSLFALLAELDPEFTAQTFAPEDDSMMANIYSAWGEQVADPGEDR